ncbi:E3 UFM1-protein ligase 1-like [Schistocerca gregaria]|uniref:E3 UFM1-protein ligase 1-like n=1 Tax=Schistocerca gregaria TaxID=7010 RepID=UPI00211E7208|nr:E3 UFM1-protein ligase 1-like [Schistocerca gregaria]
MAVKLINSGRLNALCSSDGREWITPSCLDGLLYQDIENSYAGRASIDSVCASLNYHPELIQARLRAMSESDSCDLVLLEETKEVLTRLYLDRVALQINQTLQEFGYAYVSKLQLEFRLPAPTVQRVIKKNLHTSIRGKWMKKNSYFLVGDDALLYTEVFQYAGACVILGAIFGASRPCSVETLVQSHLSGSKYRVVANACLEQASSACFLKGISEATGKCYVPNVFKKARAAWATNSYSQRGYLLYKSLSQLEVKDPKDYCQKAVPDAVLLKTRAVSEKVLDQFVQALAQCEEDCTALAVCRHPLLRNSLSEKDLEMLYQFVEPRKSSTRPPICGLLLPRGYYVSGRLLALCERLYQDWVLKEVEERGPQRRLQKLGDATDNNREDASRVPSSAPQLQKVLCRLLPDWLPVPLSDDDSLVRSLAGALAPTLMRVSLKFKNVSLERASTLCLERRESQELAGDFRARCANFRLFSSFASSLDYLAPSELSSLRSYLLSTLGRDLCEVLEKYAHKKYQVAGSLASPSEEAICLPGHISDGIDACREAVQKDVPAFLSAMSSLAASLGLSTDSQHPSRRLVSAHVENARKQLERAQNEATQLRIACMLLIAKKKAIILYTAFRHLSILIKVIHRECDPETASLADRCYRTLAETGTRRADESPACPELQALKDLALEN